MTKKLALLAIGALFLAVVPGTAALAAFKDLPASHDAYPYVEKLVTKYGVINGFPDNTYRGNKTLDRFEMSKALVLAMNYIETSREVSLKDVASKETTFKDVKSTHWAYKYLMSLTSQYQIITGYPDGTFKGKNTLNRNEVTQAVAKALARVEAAVGAEVSTKEVVLKDLPPSHWAYPSAKKLIAAGIIEPFKDGTFKGKEPV
ncbi:MAG: S-layer homology domain-containing protein, partial [Candidatus Margulisbacteria bacterium]|nr:S-layer homology domain-containing protein [Candidatus Margulisiibacteriota bacterium]